MSLFGGTHNPPRVVGDYVFGSRIGSGSFAVVWRSWHLFSGAQFAIKEIDKKHLSKNVFKEISISKRINHPNIIRLFDVIEAEYKIFLVLEYCDGGDLGAYLHRHGRLSMDVARHFVRQLAAGLKVLHDYNLIHRDLKPQNLLLASKSMTPLLKIGDFGFARYLTEQSLADTMCGSPLYMAPEIIQNHKYDAKADLWSVGAILFQLGMGRTPYAGNNQFELFQNIMSSLEIQFPEDALEVLSLDFVELCSKLLRRNPVERLTFEEFLNHSFLIGPRVKEDMNMPNRLSKDKSVAESSLIDEERHLVPGLGTQSILPYMNQSLLSASAHSEKDPSCTSNALDWNWFAPCTTSGTTKHSAGPTTSSYQKADDSMEIIEDGYVFVHSHPDSMESLTSSLDRTLNGTSSDVKAENTLDQMKEISSKFIGMIEKSDTNVLIGEHGKGNIAPSTRLQCLQQYIHALSAVAQGKLNAGSILESLSVQLVVLAIWKVAIEICVSWVASPVTSCSQTNVNQEGASSSSITQVKLDVANASAALGWAKAGFITACERTEELAKYLQGIDGPGVVPNAMGLVYQTAISSGISGAAEEQIEDWDEAASSYSRAILLLSFIISDAPLLSLNPPFSLHPDDKRRILNFLRCLQCRKNRLRALPRCPSKQTSNE